MILTYIFECILFPLISAGVAYLIYFLNAKTKELKSKTDNEIAQKYLDMLNDTITSCVIATSQTYVESLKAQGKFDKAAQEEAFKRSYENVMKLLTDEGKEYIENLVGDIQTYIYNQIEAEVNLTK